MGGIALLKKITFGYTVFLTLSRIILLILLWNSVTTVLPTTIFVLNFLMVLFGLYLLIKRLVYKTHLRELFIFLLLDAGVVIFSLIYVNWQIPLKLSLPEMLICGSVIQVLIDFVFAHYCFKNIRKQYRFLIHTVLKEDEKDETRGI